jgi:uncharacterized protein involved in tolerance to divalent cations
MFIFNWFKKISHKEDVETFQERTSEDNIEKSLWEIKEEYDLPTEEIVNVVRSKRENFDYLRRSIEKRKSSK